MGTSTGWFGIPGADGRGSTQVHVVVDGKPACGTRLSSKQQYQWCSSGIVRGWVECRRCAKMVDGGKLK